MATKKGQAVSKGKQPAKKPPKRPAPELLGSEEDEEQVESQEILAHLVALEQARGMQDTIFSGPGTKRPSRLLTKVSFQKDILAHISAPESASEAA